MALVALDVLLGFVYVFEWPCRPLRLDGIAYALAEEGREQEMQLGVHRFVVMCLHSTCCDVYCLEVALFMLCCYWF